MENMQIVRQWMCWTEESLQVKQKHHAVSLSVCPFSSVIHRWRLVVGPAALSPLTLIWNRSQNSASAAVDHPESFGFIVLQSLSINIWGFQRHIQSLNDQLLNQSDYQQKCNQLYNNFSVIFKRKKAFQF